DRGHGDHRDAPTGTAGGRHVPCRSGPTFGYVPGPCFHSAKGRQMTISVLLADDQELVRIGLRTLFTSQPDYIVAGEAADGIAAVSATRATRPDVVLMDIRMPDTDGLEATRRIVADPELDQVRVIVL